MGLLAMWRAHRARMRERMRFEAEWVVHVEDDIVRVVDAEGTSREIVVASIDAVVVETNDSGPWGADVWWLLFAADRKLGLGWPQGATGEGAVIDRLAMLPGFDHARMIVAMTSTDNQTFLLWRRAE